VTVTATGPKLFYRGPLATLYHGDSREILPALRDRADLIVTDPPYGMAYESGQRRKDEFGPIAGDDGNLDVAAILRQALKRLRNGRHLYVFGPNVLEGLDVADATQLIWDKHLFGAGNLEQPWGPSWEPIWFSAYIPSAANRIDGEGSLSVRMRRGSVIRCSRPNSRAVNRHPTEKPVELLRQLIESSSVLGETVLDPFAGSGSTLVAATIEGRRSIGIELEERYCEVTAERLQRVEAIYSRLVSA
jgi:DNA modification methylase